MWLAVYAVTSLRVQSSEWRPVFLYMLAQINSGLTPATGMGQTILDLNKPEQPPMANVKIGPSFFTKERNEYADWKWGWIREIVQNAVDAKGTSSVSFDIHTKFDDPLGPSPVKRTVITVTNDGEVMTREIIVNKLLSIGETGKGFDGSIGGFGKAKLLLYFMNASYVIHTGSLIVSGSGGEYEITEGDYFAGTRSTVIFQSDDTERFLILTRRFAGLMQWAGTFTLNGEVLVTNLKKGSPRREFEFGTVYTNKSDRNKLVVRINGIPMFTDYTSHDRLVLVELKGRSVDTLTSNRDGLNAKYRQELSAFLVELAVDKRSALRAGRSQTKTRYEGNRLAHRGVSRVSGVSVQALVTKNTPLKEFVLVGGVRVTGWAPGNPASLEGDAESVLNPWVPEENPSVLQENFIINNELDLQIPAYFRPDSGEFSQYSKRVVAFWGRCLLQLHKLFEHEAVFSVGFIFSEEAEGMFEDGDFGKVYYINPAVVVQQKNSESRSFSLRYALTEREKFLALACHEFVHGAWKLNRHDEDYSNKLTDVLGVVWKHKKDFTWCFA